jgi:hypothetical protein
MILFPSYELTLWAGVTTAAIFIGVTANQFTQIFLNYTSAINIADNDNTALRLRSVSGYCVGILVGSAASWIIATKVMGLWNTASLVYIISLSTVGGLYGRFTFLQLREDNSQIIP